MRIACRLLPFRQTRKALTWLELPVRADLARWTAAAVTFLDYHRKMRVTEGDDG